MNAHLNNLMKMINKANHIKKESVKIEYTSELIAYALFIYYSGYITDEDLNMAFNKISNEYFIKTYLSERNASINDFLLNNDLLNNYYYKILTLYQKYQLKPKQVLNLSKDIQKYFIEFLQYVNCYDLYQEIESKGRISYNSPVLHDSACIGNKNNSYIIIDEKDNVYRYISLVHEIAHALENKVLKKRKQFFDTPYTNEIMSITFNRIFYEYLNENNALTASELNIIKTNTEINCHRFVEWSYIITSAIKHNKYKINDYDIELSIDNMAVKRSLTDHNYSLGSFLSLALLNMWRKDDQIFINDIPNIIFYLNNLNLKDLIDVFSKYNCFENELDKILIKK